MPRILTISERIAQATRRQVDPQELPAPITGWNTRDALTAMEPTDAITMDNFYPDNGGVILRNGFTMITSSALAVAPVKTLWEHWAGSAHKFLAACGGHIWDITTPASPTSLKSGLTSDAWQAATFGGHTFFCNGADTVQDFNGSTVSDATFTGVTLSDLYGVFVYQQFLIFWKQNDNGFWYAGPGAVTGALTRFDLSTVTEKGGNIVTVTSFSHDGGNGVQSMVAFILSSGETVVYYGTNPGDSTAWGIVAKYRLAAPVNVRSVARYGAETFVTTVDDHVPLQQQLVALKFGAYPPRSKVSTAVATAVTANPNAFGWQALYYPNGRRLIFNIPNTNGTFDQHVYNTSQQAWCRFVGMNAYCWGVFNGYLYFGDGSGNVWLADTGSLDFGIQAIQGTCQQAWNEFAEGVRKRVSAVRAVVQSNGGGTYSFGVGFDYGAVGVGSPTTITLTGSPWDVSPWDTSLWSPEFGIDLNWRTNPGTGQAISSLLTAISNYTITWLRTDLRIESGAAL